MSREVYLSFGMMPGTPPSVVQKENLATTLLVDCVEIIARWPGAVFSVFVRRPVAGEEAYPAAVGLTTDARGKIAYVLTDVDTAAVGELQFEFWAMQGDAPENVLAKSRKLTMDVRPSLGETSGPVPLPEEPGWVETVVDAAVRAEAAKVGAEAARDGSVASAENAAQSEAGAREVLEDTQEVLEDVQGALVDAQDILEDVQEVAEQVSQDAVQAGLSKDAAAQERAGAETARAGAQEAMEGTQTVLTAAQAAATLSQGYSADSEQSALRSEQSAQDAEASAVRAEEAAQNAGSGGSSNWRMQDGNPVVCWPAEGSLMTVVASAACVVTYLDKTYTLVAGGSVEVRAGAGQSTISATAGMLTVTYDLDSVVNDKANNWGSRETTGIFARDDGLVGDVVFDSLSTECIAKFTGTGVGPSPATPWTIAGRSQVALHKRVTNLFDASATGGLPSSVVRDGNKFTLTNLYANSVLYDWSKYLLPGKQYVVSLRWSGSVYSAFTGGIYMQHTNRNDTVQMVRGGSTPGYVAGMFTAPANIMDFTRMLLYGNPSGVVTIEEIQIEAADEVTPYTDYVGRDYTATFNQLVYGLAGASCVVDWSNGAVEDPTDMIAIDGTGTWTKTGAMWRRDISGLLQTDDAVGGTSICNRFGQATVAQLTAGTANECCTVYLEGGVTYLGIQYDAMASAANLGTFLGANPLSIVARLASPRAVTGSIPLVPSFAGTNMIFTDGDGEVSFAGYLTAQALWDEVAKVNKRIDAMLGV